MLRQQIRQLLSPLGQQYPPTHRHIDHQTVQQEKQQIVIHQNKGQSLIKIFRRIVRIFGKFENPLEIGMFPYREKDQNLDDWDDVDYEVDSVDRGRAEVVEGLEVVEKAEDRIWAE